MSILKNLDDSFIFLPGFSSLYLHCDLYKDCRKKAVAKKPPRNLEGSDENSGLWIKHVSWKKCNQTSDFANWYVIFNFTRLLHRLVQLGEIHIFVTFSIPTVLEESLYITSLWSVGYIQRMPRPEENYSIGLFKHLSVYLFKENGGSKRCDCVCVVGGGRFESRQNSF